MGSSQDRSRTRVRRAPPLGCVAAAALTAWLGAGAARADDVTDAELSGHAAHAYLSGAFATAGSLDDADYRELARVDDEPSGVQAVALERRRDHAVVVAYGGTDAAEPVDLLADLGIAAAELRYVVADAAFGVVELAESQGWIPAAGAPAARAALLGKRGGPELDPAPAIAHGKARGRGPAHCPAGTFFDPADHGSCWACPADHVRGVGRIKAKDACLGLAWRSQAEAVRAAGIDITRATEEQLAVARRFLDQVLAMKDLGGRPITVAGVVVTGHSLGGFIAQIVAAERGARGVTFNAPGAQHYRPELHSTLVRNLARRHDLIGRFGKHLGTTELWDDVPFKAKKGESKIYFARNHSIDQFHATLVKAGV